jgi:hypothetical protein
VARELPSEVRSVEISRWSGRRMSRISTMYSRRQKFSPRIGFDG